MVTDPIADYLTTIRNGLKARHPFVYIPHSKVKAQITQILKEQGYIHNYQVEKEPAPQGRIKIILKYQPHTKAPAIVTLKRISTPGRRQYTPARQMPDIVNGLGIAILSTPQGIITNKAAKQRNIGGELLCAIY